MTRRCSVCDHDDHEAIDHELVGGVGYRDIAKRRGLSSSALFRHAQAHVSPALTRVAAGREDEHAVALLERVEDLYERARRILTSAEQDGKPGVGLAAIRELRGIVELLGKVTGELDDRPHTTVNLLVSPEWLALRGAITEALSAHPQARAAVAQAIAELEAPE